MEKGGVVPIQLDSVSLNVFYAVATSASVFPISSI